MWIMSEYELIPTKCGIGVLHPNDSLPKMYQHRPWNVGSEYLWESDRVSGWVPSKSPWCAHLPPLLMNFLRWSKSKVPTIPFVDCVASHDKMTSCDKCQIMMNKQTKYDLTCWVNILDISSRTEPVLSNSNKTNHNHEYRTSGCHAGSFCNLIEFRCLQDIQSAFPQHTAFLRNLLLAKLYRPGPDWWLFRHSQMANVSLNI